MNFEKRLNALKHSAKSHKSGVWCVVQDPANLYVMEYYHGLNQKNKIIFMCSCGHEIDRINYCHANGDHGFTGVLK